MRALRSILPIAALSIGALIVSSILQKSYLGVPITLDGFFAPLANGLVLGVSLGVWVHRCKEASRQARVAAEKTVALNRELLKREDELRRGIEEKRVLIGEMHHRVRNNLQILGSLMTLEESGCTDADEAVSIAYRSMLRRIEALTAAYDGIGKPGIITELSADELVRQVVDGAIGYAGRERAIAAVIDAGELTLDVRLAVPFAVLLSELVDLSVTRSFRDREIGTVRVELRGVGSTCECRYSDDGDGIALFERRESCAEALSREVIGELAGQLGGRLTLGEGEGEYILRFPALTGVPCN